MIAFILRILVGFIHNHKWEEVSEGQAYMDAWERRPMRSIKLKCSKCGEIKSKLIGA
jgi:hypothetical protein